MSESDATVETTPRKASCCVTSRTRSPSTKIARSSRRLAVYCPPVRMSDPPLEHDELRGQLVHRTRSVLGDDERVAKEDALRDIGRRRVDLDAEAHVRLERHVFVRAVARPHERPGVQRIEHAVHQ